MTATTAASPQELILALPEAAKRALTIQLLSEFDSTAILEMLREVKPAHEPVYDYEDPGPLTDEEIAFCADQAALRMDEDEAVYEKSAAR